jgi:uncharacterized protein YbjT (DUF2867 family)
MGTTPRILVTGATGQIGREVVALLRAGNVPVRALTRNPSSAHLPAGAEVVHGDLTAPETLDPALDDVDAVFLVWMAPLEAAAAAIAKIASRPAAVDRPALVTSAIEDVTGTPARTFRHWAADHAAGWTRNEP